LVHKVFFPKSIGIPFIANIFAQIIKGNCDYTNYNSPNYSTIMDADAYFKNKISNMVDIILTNYSIGLLSGHESIEHKIEGKK